MKLILTWIDTLVDNQKSSKYIWIVAFDTGSVDEYLEGEFNKIEANNLKIKL